MGDQDIDKDAVRAAIQTIADGVLTIQRDMGLNDKGFIVLLAHYTKIPQKVCRQVIDACFQLEAEYTVPK